MTSSETSVCDQCGRVIRASVAGGQCVHCLMQVGFSSIGHNEKLVDDQFTKAGVLPKFGDYELIEEIARGGMGVVYRAKQVSLNREVAVKMILAGQLATPEAVRRFQAEAETAGNLNHPAIVPIYDVGESETQHFFSMRLIDGGNLADRTNEFALQPGMSATEARLRQRRSAELMSKVAHAMDYAHNHGVLHRDLKPSNILIDHDSNPHVTDFGLAKLATEGSSGLTASMTVLGSPSYMSPEQAKGGGDEITTSADVYGLGASFYELLTGQPPFVANSPLSTMRMVIDSSPQPPHQLNDLVHPDLETIALKCLEKRPQDRYQSVREVADELDRFLRGEPINARPIGVVKSVGRWCGRNQVLAASSAMLALAMLIGAVGVTWQWLRAESANQELKSTIAHLNWTQMTQLVDQGDSRAALAQIALMLRKDPENWKASTYALSILQNTRFHLPNGHAIEHPDSAAITTSVISPDATLIASASLDKSARLWDVNTSQQVGPPLMHDGPVRHIVFGNQGSTLFSAADGGDVRVWKVSDGSLITSLHHPQDVASLVITPDQNVLSACGSHLYHWDIDSPEAPVRRIKLESRIKEIKSSTDGARVLCLGRNGTASVWEVATGDQVAVMEPKDLRSASISPDGTRVATLRRGQPVIEVRDLPDSQVVATIKSQRGDFNMPVFSPDGNTIATGAIPHEWARIWSTTTGLPTGPELTHKEKVTSLKFFDDGHRLLTLSRSNSLRIWDVESGKQWTDPIKMGDGIRTADISSDGRILLTGFANGATDNTLSDGLQVWRIRPPHIPPDLSQNEDGTLLSAITSTKDGKLVASSVCRYKKPSGEAHHIAIMDVESGELIRNPVPTESEVYTMAFTEDQKRLVALTRLGILSIFSGPNFSIVNGPIDTGNRAQPGRLARDGRTIAMGTPNGIIKLWSLEPAAEQWATTHSDARMNDLRFSHDGRQIAGGCNGGVVGVYDSETGSPIWQRTISEADITTVVFNPTSTHVLAAATDFSARILDAATGEIVQEFRHRDDVMHAAYSPDGKFAATASRDGTAAIWNLETGQLHIRVLQHGQSLLTTSFNADGKFLLSADQKGIRLWDVATCEPLTTLLPHPTQSSLGLDTDGVRSMFVNDEKYILHGAASHAARLWPLSIIEKRVPRWFPTLIESIAMQRIKDSETLPVTVKPQSYLDLRDQILKMPPDDEYVRWAHQWFESHER